MVDELSAGHDVIALDRAALDVTDAPATLSLLARLAPSAIVNCMGYNAVDAAETHPVEAIRVNAIAVRTLARAAAENEAAFVHFSSDFVFDGRGTEPYVEADPPNPASVYATSKLLGEWLAADAPRAYVLRVESLFGRGMTGVDRGSVAMIVSSLRSGKEPTVFSDRTVSPTYVIDASRATRRLLEERMPPGIYHCVSSGHCTWLEFAEEAARQLGVAPKVRAVRMSDVNLPAARPQYCALSNAKLAALGIAMPSWQDALGRYLKLTAVGP